MSLAIVTTTNEGNILAADSMETYRNSLGDTREGSQTRMKLFQLNKRVAAVACGLSFLENKNVQQHIKIFIRENNLEDMLVKDVVDKLYDYFYGVYSRYLNTTASRKVEDYQAQGYKKIKSTIDLECITLDFDDLTGKKGSQKFYQPIMEFLIAGHDPDGSNNVFKITIPDPKEKNGIVMKLNGDQCGATWIGQTDVLVRIIRGWSPEIKRSKVIQELPEHKKNELLKLIDDQEYLVNWGTMTLQDAIEFSDLAIKTTESIQKMTDGTWSLPGSSPGVGGPVDVAVITPEKGFVWVQRKNLHIGDNIVNLEETKNLS
ncbi:hypothetical protein IT413_04260 [Candidatus Peregrinibacteria bacterium]|nr:hypothetical protein [Candidatus Peregrinibacteria bacterium]